MRISDWSSDVCSSDLDAQTWPARARLPVAARSRRAVADGGCNPAAQRTRGWPCFGFGRVERGRGHRRLACAGLPRARGAPGVRAMVRHAGGGARRAEEHTSELQSLMRISYAVFCLYKK